MNGYKMQRLEIIFNGSDNGFIPRVTIYNVKSVEVLDSTNCLHVVEERGKKGDEQHEIVKHNFPLQNVREWDFHWHEEKLPEPPEEPEDRISRSGW